MAWLNIKPENQGGGRQPKEPVAKLYSTGQFTLSHAAVAILGDPAKVRVQIEPDLRRIRLQPTTPNDNGGFALAGGGNSPHRIADTPVPAGLCVWITTWRSSRAAWIAPWMT